MASEWSCKYSWSKKGTGLLKALGNAGGRECILVCDRVRCWLWFWHIFLVKIIPSVLCPISLLLLCVCHLTGYLWGSLDILMKHLMHQICFFPVPWFLLTYLYYFTMKRWTIVGHERYIEKEKFLSRNNHYYFISLLPCRVTPESNMLPLCGRGGATFWVWHGKGRWAHSLINLDNVDFELLVYFLEEGARHVRYPVFVLDTFQQKTRHLLFLILPLLLRWTGCRSI